MSWLIRLLKAEENLNDIHGQRGQDLAPFCDFSLSSGSSHAGLPPIPRPLYSSFGFVALVSLWNGSSFSAFAFSSNVTSTQVYP